MDRYLPSIPFRLSIFFLLLVLSSPTGSAQDFKTMSFDTAAEGLLLRSMPLNVAFPADYHLYKNEPMGGNWMWTTPASYAFLQENGHTSPDEGIFQIRISRDIGYDRSSGTFICGPNCGESDFVAMMEAAGFSDIQTETKTVHGIPIFIVEATMLEIEGFPPSKIYMAHLATFIDTNAVLFAYTPPVSEPERGERAWNEAKRALLDGN